MATEKRLIELIECLEHCADNTDCERCSRWLYPCDEHCVDDLLATAAKELRKLVDAVPVDEIKLHHVIIDNEGVPEVKLQIGDRYFILRTDPVDVREVVHGRWVHPEDDVVVNEFFCSVCDHREVSLRIINPLPGGGCKADEKGNFYYPPRMNYCPNCGAKMDGDGNG